MNYFNELAADFDREPKRIELASEVGDAMIENLRFSPGCQVMDYGAGTGLLTFKLQPHAGTITAVDSSEQMLDVIAAKIARVQVHNVQTLKWNVESDALLPASFDIIVGSMVLHHIENTQGAMDRFAMMLKDGGQIAFADLDAEEGDFHSDATAAAHRGFDRDEFAAHLRMAGFRNVRFSTASVVRKPTSSGVEKEYPVFLAAAEK
ncbi:MAG: class I SAM-dependent methyltransferase [Candidatus Omnitrophica bacterium]|nr:class I SAM-dependent methyltransferase [Candidatus Omnitrophota bacterium]